MGAHGPQSGHRSRSVASQRKRRRAAFAPGTGPAPACAPAGSLLPHPLGAVGGPAPWCCRALARGEWKSAERLGLGDTDLTQAWFLRASRVPRERWEVVLSPHSGLPVGS